MSSVVEPMKDTAPLRIQHNATPGLDPYNPPNPDTEAEPTDIRYLGYTESRMEKPRAPRLYTPRPFDPIKIGQVYHDREPVTPPARKERTRGQRPYSPNPYQPIKFGYMYHEAKKGYEKESQPPPPLPPVHQHRVPPPLPVVRRDNKSSSRDVLPPEKGMIMPPKPLARSMDAMPFGEDMQKIQQQIKDADEDLLRYKEEKRRRVVEGEIERRQDYHQLQNYNPWGKPGAGAPMEYGADGYKKQRFLGDDAQSSESSEHAPPFPNQSPGGGAPLRTSSGRVMAEVPIDPQTRFLTTKKGRELNEKYRYRTDAATENQYAQDLDVLMKQRQHAAERERIQDLQAEMDSLRYDPYGKPGAGAPNKKGSEPALPPYEPWGKGYGHPRRDDEGNVERYKFHDFRHGQPIPPNTDDYQYKIRLPDPSLLPEPHNVQPLFENGDSQPDASFLDPRIYQHSRDHPRDRYADSMKQLYYPFGSPGGGAPNRDKYGNLNTVFYEPSSAQRDVEEQRRRALAAKMYTNELEREMLEQRLKKIHEQQYRSAPYGISVPEQMQRGQVGKPQRDAVTGLLANNPLRSSDITNLLENSPRVPYQQDHLDEFQHVSHQYGNELSRMAQERARQRHLDRLQDRQEAIQHGTAFPHYFGRPGGGAPNPAAGNRMTDFDDSLFKPDKEKNIYLKPVDHIAPVHNTNYVRNNVNSHHSNQYEFQSGQDSDAPKRLYQLKHPFALHTSRG